MHPDPLNFNLTRGLMHWIDWILTGMMGVVLLATVLYVRRYTKSVADFLSANRCAGRYLLTTVQGATAVGIVNTVANYEKIYRAGFADAWWTIMFLAPIMMILGLTGWVIYRYRETRAMTLAQFFEMRYTRRFRIFAGMLCLISGVLNYGIFPQITANFFMHFCGFPDLIPIAGLMLPTRAVIIFVFLAIGLWLALSGGFLTVLVADFFQGQLMNVFTLLIAGFLLYKIGWGHMLEILQQAPAGKSMLDPFDQGSVDSFTWGFFLIMLFVSFYGRGVWQGGAAANTAARTPHEARMAGILAQLRVTINYLLLLLVPISVYVLMNSPELSSSAAAVQAEISGLADPQLQKQMLVPLGISTILPIGLMGVFLVLFFMAAITTDDSYLHAWGSIFIQDVVLPLRKKPFTPRQHLRWLRLSVAGVAVFAFFWSICFPLKEYIYMYQQITGAIFMGGAGSAVIGGLYWKRGTTAGAWTGMILGSLCAVAGIVARVSWDRIPYLSARWAECPLNGVQLTLISGLLAIAGYVVVSLLTRNPPEFDMDRMLHRGKYDSKHEHQQITAALPKWQRALGMNASFTRGDRLIYYFNICWAGILFGAFVTGSVIRFFRPIRSGVWASWWTVYLYLMIFMAVTTAVWFLIGGVRDLKTMFQLLRTGQVDESDDGSVRK